MYIDIFYLLKYPYVPYSSFFEKFYVLVYVYQYHVILCFIAKLLSTNSPNMKTPFCTHMGPQLMIEGSCCIQPIIEVNAYIQRDKPGTDLIAKKGYIFFPYKYLLPILNMTYMGYAVY